MNYEEKYNQALERARIEYKNEQSKGNIWVCENLSTIFPELRESEDERIRKEIVQFLQLPHPQFVGKRNYEEWIAWLEKQSEQKPVDKIEPKFKIDDWITNGKYTWKVIDIKPLDYILRSQSGDVVDDTISYVDEEFHLWTIQDAKDGDVLLFEGNYNSIVLFQGIGINGEGRINYHCKCDLGNYSFGIQGNVACLGIIDKNANDFHPATKEQRDLLFQKMKEAGYKWDAEKKELRKIEQNHSWSDEDERILNKIQDNLREFYVDKKGYPYVAEPDSPEMMENNWLMCIKNRVQPQPKQKWSEEDEKMFDKLYEILYIYGYSSHPEIDLSSNESINLIYWLKSIKPFHWKPSEEQLRVLQIAIRDYGICAEKNVLESLYDELKKL